ncbi:hypothetical protein ADL00_06945 [Streptomyces sp. AS58]|uniref:hypothetical protein n=1 Tax=Streptomyces sp. AS58 TaxID=1519489 RepID=UPI0006ADEB32|nr:hypothetical protein [Streptomyces sp. AS58]KOV71876.1 hypothetical protein ADL00_06945 [Streptomyces sp. AS58]
MTDPNRKRRAVWSITAWWMLLTITLWLLGRATTQPATLTGCAASAALLVAVGEAGHGLHRRLQARKGRSHSPEQ